MSFTSDSREEKGGLRVVCGETTRSRGSESGGPKTGYLGDYFEDCAANRQRRRNSS